MIDLDREMRALLEEDARHAPLAPDARAAIHRARRRQVGVVLTALAMVAAVAAGSIAGIEALIRASEQRIPAEPPIPPGSLEAVASQPVSFWGLVADTDGVLWSTTPGLTRFDPATGSLRTFTAADDPAFAGVGDDVLLAREGGVWLASYGDELVVRRFDGERFVETSPPTPFHLSDIAEGPDGTIWASGDGVFSWSGGSWVEAPTEGRPTTGAGPIAVDTAGNVWAANRRPGPEGFGNEWFGVSRFDGVRWTTYATQEVFPFDDVPSDDMGRGEVDTIVPGLDGDVWVGGRGGVAHFVDGAWTSYGSSAFGLEQVYSIAVADADVWVGGSAAEGTPPSIVRFDGATWTLVSEGLDDERWLYPFSQVVATPQEIWAVASAAVVPPTRSTLYRLDGSRWEPIITDERPASVGHQIAAAGSDDLWTRNDHWESGVWRLQDDRWTRFDERNGVPGGPVNDLLVTAGGTVWMASEGGLASFDGARWELVAPGEHTAIALGPDGKVWTASRSVVEAWTVQPVGGTALPGLVGLATVSSLAVGPAGDVWAGSAGVYLEKGGGLAHFDGESWQTVEPVANAHALVRDVEATPDGDVWVLAAVRPEEKGEPRTVVLARRHDGAWTTFGEADGIPLDPGELKVAPDGQLLLLGSEGLFVLRDGAWDLVQEGGFTTLSIAPDGTVWLGAMWDGLFRLPNT